MVAVAIIGGAVIAGGASAIGASKQSKAVSESADASITEQRRQFDVSQELTRPRRDAENAALEQLSALLGLGGAGPDFSGINIPGQDFVLGQGQQAIERSAAARGGQISGNTLTDLTSFAQGVSNQNFLSNFLNPLLGLATGGAGAQSAGAAQNLGANIGNTLQTAGVNRANIIGQGFQGVNQAAQGGLSNFLLQDALKAPTQAQGFV